MAGEPIDVEAMLDRCDPRPRRLYLPDTRDEGETWRVVTKRTDDTNYSSVKTFANVLDSGVAERLAVATKMAVLNDREEFTGPALRSLASRLDSARRRTAALADALEDVAEFLLAESSDMGRSDLDLIRRLYWKCASALGLSPAPGAGRGEGEGQTR